MSPAQILAADPTTIEVAFIDIVLSAYDVVEWARLVACANAAMLPA